MTIRGSLSAGPWAGCWRCPALTAGLIVAQHRASQEGRPLFAFGAGLTNLPSVLVSFRSYPERLLSYSTIGALSPGATRGALADPARTVGGRFLPDAPDVLLTAPEGYPYVLQEFGFAIWSLLAASPFGTEDGVAAIEVSTAY